MNLITTPNDVLLKKAKDIHTIDKSVQKLIRDMKKVLRESTIGVGLAAPQVGQSVRLFIVSPNLPNLKNPEKATIRVFINPVIVHALPASTIHPKHKTGTKKKSGLTLEGCLSIPDVWGEVARGPRIRLQYQDESGRELVETVTGLMATIVQHEVDHLNGVLFTQHVLEQGQPLFRTDFKSGKLVEIEI